ncbi:hypothetical protein A2594_01995 [Candidatus Woesebacteria bacterium RIFOXYD1_FULL_41_28]|uniref:Uncharacterized protein n=3 Tax=Candidatus Woeseibacteriota TaxID=1752722 RepID=A0A1F8DL14_9BACT|nr:MAG: hypothetical protein A2393_01970 [Candidatus Woesebacteria bacterium RIFOXYB1_FULL_41_13]OGM88485.1 MAG: hypothetical protein A2594_01995 [Candidatus Woesebacteria bacterium RIFOXYD1_FULL_41_28]
MKYFLAIFITAVAVFLGATVYYKGLPKFANPVGVSVTSSEATDSPQASASAPLATSGGVNISEIRAALAAKHGDTSDWTISVTGMEGDFAKGSVSTGDGGGMWFAAKVNGVWKLVWDGNGIIECSSVSPYPNFPADMIPQCYSTASGQLITR